MLLTTAAVAIGRKIADERAKKKEARQGLLSIGDSDLAMRAFAHQTTKAIQDGKAGIQRSGTDVKYEDPTSLDVSSPKASNPSISRPQDPGHDTQATTKPSPSLASPVKSEKSILAIAPPKNETSDGAWRSVSQRSNEPPSYSPHPDIPPETPSSVYSEDSDRRALSTSASSSFIANDVNAIKVRTKGSDLKSGFPYHPALFDLRVRPDLWDEFTHQIVESTRFSAGDHAKMWAAATATACTGALVTSVFVGRNMNRSLQEKKVKAGLLNTTAGGLGDTLQQWNDTYFRERGLFVHLELSDSAKKKEEGKSKAFRKPSSMYSSREERDKKREDRKFVIVVTKLDEEGQPMDAINEISEMAAEGPGAVAELPAIEDAKYNVAELPGEEGIVPVELPAMELQLPAAYSLGYGSEKLKPPVGYAELESDTMHLLDKTTLSNEDDDQTAAEIKSTPPMVTTNSYKAPHKETT